MSVFVLSTSISLKVTLVVVVEVYCSESGSCSGCSLGTLWLPLRPNRGPHESILHADSLLLV